MKVVIWLSIGALRCYFVDWLAGREDVAVPHWSRRSNRSVWKDIPSSSSLRHTRQFPNNQQNHYTNKLSWITRSMCWMSWEVRLKDRFVIFVMRLGSKASLLLFASLGCKETINPCSVFFAPLNPFWPALFHFPSIYTQLSRRHRIRLQHLNIVHQRRGGYFNFGGIATYTYRTTFYEGFLKLVTDFQQSTVSTAGW